MRWRRLHSVIDLHGPPLDRSPVVIEDDVTIGIGAFVLKGVTLGKGSDRAPGSVVTSDVPGWCDELTGTRSAIADESRRHDRHVDLSHDWWPKKLPSNVTIGDRCWLHSAYAFAHYRSEEPIGVGIGNDCGIYINTLFDIGPEGRGRPSVITARSWG